ncbi:ESPR-type extended signal peptide-containing protein [Phascolarctobacterium succinatutens]|uniref:ESPR-type extended signal peptide-containing protein n=1 Tax=Phascolarctobacterium succinatutens TaxID=626940 RepID=UPI0023F62CF0|nr:ESPR-type extended signal peptide-containing protein [Phascolarctobacterium succinatutens]
MNKIFKVIWNEARNAYVVVSEIAKNHGSKSCSTKKLLAMLIATGVMTCASFDVLAAEPSGTDTAKSQYVAFADPTHTLYSGNKTTIDGHEYIYDATNKYWVREGYVLTVDENGGKYTPLSQKDVRADVAYTRTGVPEGILQSVTSTVSASGTVTNMGESLNKITAGSFAGVSHAGGTEVEGSWDYIIKDASWEGKVASSNYKDGYVNLYAGKTATAPKGFVNTDSKDLIWDDSRQAYFYKNQRVDYSNMYVINGKLGVFTNADSTKVYTGTVYGKNNEILMTVKDKDNNFYSYWAAEVTDPSATMATYRVEEYNKNLAKLVENDDALNRNDIKEVTLTNYENSATIGLLRNGDKAVDGAITVTSGGGTDGNDTFVKISNAADTKGKTFATGSKVEAIVDNGATTGIKINGQDYTIKSGSKVSVTQTADKKTTTITVDDTATTITDTDTTYTEGDGIEISDANAISVSKNLTGMQSIKGAGGIINLAGSAITVNETTFNKDGRIQNVANGTETKDAVNFGQLQETNTKVENLKVEAGKHTTLVNGENTTVELVGDGKDGKQYKVNVDLSQYAKTEDVAVVYVDNNKNKSLHTTNSGAVESNAIALGKDASAHENSVVIGDGAYTQKGNLLTGSGYSVALGNNAVTGTKSTSVGYKAIGGRVGTITVGYNSYNGAAYGTVIGTESKINYSAQKTANAAATIVGAQSEIIADNKPYSGVANGIFGSANKIQNSNGVTIQGSGNTVTNAYKDMSGSGFNLGGVSVKKDAGAVGVIGGMNTVSNQIYTNVIGFGNTVAGDADNISHDVFVAGSRNNLSKVSDSIVMGNDNTISDRSNVISFGHQNTISASNAVAIGNGASVSVEGGVALGVGSVADRAAEVVGYGAAEGETGIAWKATNGAVSVGSSVEGKKITRQITNVAAGTEDTDAVNVAQLKKVSEAAASASQGWKLKTQNGNASDVKPGATVEFDGDANIQVGNDGNKVSVTLKDALTGITSITGAGAGSISFADGGKVKVNDVIIEKGGKITGVAAGEAGTDAVNVSQLNKVSAAAKTEVVKGTNIASVGETTATDGHTVYTVNAKGTSVSVDGNFNLVETTDAATNVTNYGISLKDSVTIGGTHAVTINGTDGTVTGLTNTTWNKDSITSGRAATEDQLQAVATEAGKHTTLSNGKNTTVKPVTTADGHLEYKVDVNDELKDIKSIIGAGEGAGSISFANDGIKFNNKVTIDNTGKISGVANGIADNDAVNVSQLNKVSAAAKTEVVKGTNIASVGETTATDGHTVYTVNAKGTSVSVDGNFNLVETTDAATNVTNYGISLKDSVTIGGTHAVTINGTDGTVTGLTNTTWNKDSITSGRAATEDQLQAVATEAGKHTTLSDGKNTTVESTVKDGQTDYKVNVAGDLTDITSVANGDSKINLNKDSIIISNGNKYFAITNSGIGMSYIGADYSAKSIMLGENGTTISGGLNVAGSKITGVAAGEAYTDAVNVGQLNAAVQAGNTDTHIKAGGYGVGTDNKVNMQLVDKNGKDAGTVTITDVAKASDVGNVNDIADDLKNGGEGKTTVVEAVNNLNTKVGDLQYSKVKKGEIENGDSTTTAIGKLNQKLTDVAATAAKHTTVTQGDNITVTKSDEPNENGGENYNVALNKYIELDSVTTGDTVMNNDGVKVGTDVSLNKGGLKVGDKVSVSATAVTAGQTSINNDGLAVGPNTSLKADELKVDGKTYIDKNGLNANGMQITNVADGKENSDAVNVGQLKESEKTINNRIDGVENQVISNSNRINQLGNRVNKVGAGAAALAALHPMDFDPDDKLTFSAGYGNYGGENAAAIGAYYRPDEKVMFSVAGTVGNGENMVNAGVSFALDRTNHVSNSRTALAREVIDLRGQLAVMGAKMAKMEKALGMLDETKTKLFPDIPANHWAYEYIAKLAGNGYIEGYPDGNFGGDRLMTRYEFAAMLYRAIENGAALEEKIIKEFEPELGRIRVDRISGEDGDRDKIERVRVNDTKGERDHYGNKLAK